VPLLYFSPSSTVIPSGSLRDILERKYQREQNVEERSRERRYRKTILPPVKRVITLFCGQSENAPVGVLCYSEKRFKENVGARVVSEGFGPFPIKLIYSCPEEIRELVTDYREIESWNIGSRLTFLEVCLRPS
jgi:hypothetical protein